MCIVIWLQVENVCGIDMNFFFRFSTKAAIGVGVVYITVDQGIWGDSKSTSAAYDRLYDIMPGTKSVSEKVWP